VGMKTPSIFLRETLDGCTYTVYSLDMNTNTTATSTYGTVREVTITTKGRDRMVHTTSGVLLGDVEGMERLGWEFGA
jgi:hypothetical protein